MPEPRTDKRLGLPFDRIALTVEPMNVPRVISLSLRGIAVIAILGVGIAMSAYLVGTRPVPAASASVVQNLVVGGLEVHESALPRIWEGFGTLVARDAADVAAEVSATVLERPEVIEAGRSISKGDVIVRLDPIDFQQRVAASQQTIATWEARVESLSVEELRLREQAGLARDLLAIEERELSRLEEVMSSEAGTSTELERRRAALVRVKSEISRLEQQVEDIGPRRAELNASILGERSNLAIARQNLERTTVRAPIDGVLQNINVDVGEHAAAGSIVARIVDPAVLELPIRLPASAGASIRIGDAALMLTDSAALSVPGAILGSVSRITPEVDPATRTIGVYVEFQLTQDDLDVGVARPGQFVRGRIATKTTWPVMLVPRRAVLNGSVFVADRPNDEGARIARRRPVEVAFHLDGTQPGHDADERQWSAVRAGLTAGEVVILTNLDQLEDGKPVQVEASTEADRAGREGP